MTSRSIKRFPSNVGWIICGTIIVVAAFLFSRYFCQLLLIQGDSMYPTYHNMQLAVLDKYHKEYTYGDVIAFRCEGLQEVLVKRIVAVPGDSVLINEGTLYVNGEISGVYPTEGLFEFSGIAGNSLRLTEGHFFVIGDNVSISKDSRYDTVGFVDTRDVIGKLL